jgi:hypothetical protein
MLHPDRWVWNKDKKDYVPELCKLKLIPGLQGVEDNGADGHARGYYTSRGYVVINNGDARLQKLIPGGKYRTRWLALGPNPGRQVWAYGWPWEGYEWVGNELEWRVSDKILNKFVGGLVTAGIVPPMSYPMRERMYRDAKRTADRLDDRRSASTKGPTRKGEALYKAEQEFLQDLLENLKLHSKDKVEADPSEELQMPDPDEDDGDALSGFENLAAVANKGKK